MNKISKFLLSLLPLLSMLFVVSCGENPEPEPEPKPTPEPNETSVINLKSTEVNAEAKGGNYTVNYTITNPIEGEIVEVVANEDWVSNFDRATAGIIKFEVAENTVEEPREAVVEVSYKGATTVSFAVKQAAAKRQDLTFTVDEAELGYRSCFFDIYPSDQNTAYLVNIYSMDYIDQYKLYNDDDLFNDDMEYFAWLGAFSGLDAMDVVDIRKIYGNTYDKEAINCRPNTEYLLYMYYIDVNTGERLSDIHRHPFTTPSVPLQDVAFEFNYTIDGPAVTVEATAPASYLDAYYFDLLPKKDVDAQAAELGITAEQFIELWWNSIACNEMDQQYSPESIIASIGSYGTDTYSAELYADTEYYLFAFTLNEWALCSSVPQTETITTGSVQPSDNEITIIVTDITPRGATIRYRTTNNDPYVSGWATKEEWNTYGATDRERIKNIIATFDFGTDYLHGDVSYTEKMGFTPDTEHVVFAMGYRGGIATTQLFTAEFKTVSDAPSSETLTLREMGYFDITAVNEIDPTIGSLSFASSYAFYPMELIKSSEDLIAYTCGFVVTPSNMSGYTYDTVMMYMLNDGEAPLYTYRFVEYGINNLITAVGRDTEGRYTEMYYKYFYCEPSECNPDNQAFVDWMHSWIGTTSVPTSVVYDVAKAEKSSASLFTRKEAAPAKEKYSTKALNTDVVVPAADVMSTIRK